LKQLPAFHRQSKLRDVRAKRNSRREPAVTVLRRSTGSDLKAVSSNSRGFTIAVFSLPLLLVMTASVRAQAPAAPRPAPHEAARPANAQDMFGWLRQFAPTQRRQSWAVSSPPLPRPRPTELTPTAIGPSPTSEELAPAPLEPSRTPTEVAPRDEPNEGPLND
jgi:hypothetical protein